MDTIGRMLLAQRESRRDEVAVHDARSRMTYGERCDAALRVAAWLVERGIAPGDRVALLMPPTTEWVAVHFGAMVAGAIIVPLNLAWQAEELAFAMRQAGVRAAIAAATVRGRPLAERLLAALSTPVRLGDDPAETPAAPAIDFGVLLGEGAAPVGERAAAPGKGAGLPPGWHAGAGMLAHMPSQAAAAEVRRRIDATAPHDSCCLVYTSGSTGRPKPAILHHYGLLHAAWEYGRGLGVTERDRILVPWPTFHVSGMSAGTLVGNLRGAPCWLMETYDPREAIETIEREGITTFHGFDTTFTLMFGRPEFTPQRVASMERMLLATGPAMYDRVFKAFPGLQIGMKCYASTEACGPSALVYPDLADPDTRKYGHGVPCPDVEIRVADPVTGRTLDTDVRGEIRLRGPILFKGYFGMERETREAFDEDGWFRTGDLGWFDAAGVLFYDGRLKRMIKTGGENVSEREVECFLEERVPGANIAQVVGVPDPVWGEAVVAFIEPIAGHTVTEELVKASCKGKVADYKIPKRVWVVAESEWPRNEVGKISKEALLVRAKAGYSGG